MTTLTTLICTLVLAPKQDATMFAPPAEIKEAAFLLGDWKSEGTGMGMDGGMAKITGTAKSTMVMDRWIQFDTKDTMEGLGTMTGRFMVTYNPATSKWEGVWFDSLTAHSMKCIGTLKEGTLAMMSEETTGMDGNPTQYRINYTKKSDSHVECKIDMKMGDQFMNMLTHNYKK